MARRRARGKSQSAPLLSEAEDRYLVGATVVGGGGNLPLRVGATVSVRFTPTEVRIREDDRLGNPVLSIPEEWLRDVSLGGPGIVTSGGGFVGGGFGMKGAAEGMIAASVLNALTTSSQVNSIVRLDTELGEVFLHSTEATPEQLRVMLSPVFWRIQQRRSGRTISYDLSGWTVGELTELSGRLVAGGVSHSWNGSQLVVHASDKDTVDLLRRRIEAGSTDDNEATGPGSGRDMTPF